MPRWNQSGQDGSTTRLAQKGYNAFSGRTGGVDPGRHPGLERCACYTQGRLRFSAFLQVRFPVTLTETYSEHQNRILCAVYHLVSGTQYEDWRHSVKTLLQYTSQPNHSCILSYKQRWVVVWLSSPLQACALASVSHSTARHMVRQQPQSGAFWAFDVSSSRAIGRAGSVNSLGHLTYISLSISPESSAQQAPLH